MRQLKPKGKASKTAELTNWCRDLILPINCLGCDEEGKFICQKCFKQIPVNNEPPKRFKEKTALSGLIVASYYKHPLIKEAVKRFKYDFAKGLTEPLADLMTEKLKCSHFIPISNSIIIPVPLHAKRLRWRGFNQAELLAGRISNQLKIPLEQNILTRHKHRLPQVKIKDALSRKENISGVFKINKKREKKIKNKTVILIDDITTTGATLEEAAKTLKILKPSQIWAVVLARG